jgi:hypothetical protein
VPCGIDAVAKRRADVFRGPTLGVLILRWCEVWFGEDDEQKE